MAHNYILQVTAGPSYDPKTHKIVAVNTPEPLSISSDLMDIELNVRVQVRLYRNFLQIPKQFQLQKLMPISKQLELQRSPQKLPIYIPLLLHSTS